MKNVFDFQIAAVMCVHNLSFADDAGAADRQTKLREVGVHAILHQVLSHPGLVVKNSIIFYKRPWTAPLVLIY